MGDHGTGRSGPRAGPRGLPPGRASAPPSSAARLAPTTAGTSRRGPSARPGGWPADPPPGCAPVAAARTSSTSPGRRAPRRSRPRRRRRPRAPRRRLARRARCRGSRGHAPPAGPVPPPRPASWSCRCGDRHQPAQSKPGQRQIRDDEQRRPRQHEDGPAAAGPRRIRLDDVLELDVYAQRARPPPPCVSTRVGLFDRQHLEGDGHTQWPTDEPLRARHEPPGREVDAGDLWRPLLPPHRPHVAVPHLVRRLLPSDSDLPADGQRKAGHSAIVRRRAWERAAGACPGTVLVPTLLPVRLALLGPVAVDDGEVPLDLGPPKQRALLALLALHADTVVPLDTLVDRLWNGAPPGRAEAGLQIYVSHLRSLLEPGRRRGDPARVLQTRPPGYLLDTHALEVDVRDFADATGRGRSAAVQRQHAEAVRHFEAALALWRGEALADVRDAPWAQAEAARLEQQRLDAVEDLAQARLDAGDPRRVAGDLVAFVDTHPLRERAWGLLALALYRCDRQADALAALA